MRVVILVIVVVAAVVAVNAVQGERTAILPIKVWEHLVDAPEYQCWILPMEGYSVSVPVFDDEVDPLHEWWGVKSTRCKGIARVGR